MIEDAKSNSSDSICEQQQDDQYYDSKLEESFMSECSQAKEEKIKNVALFSCEVPRSIQVMFILFSAYQDDIINIGLNSNCRAKIALNKIKISSQICQKDAEKCRQQIIRYLQKLVYIPFDHGNKFKVLQSPFFNQKAAENGFRICKFNKQVYCHTRSMPDKELKMQMKDLFSGHNIFTVIIKYKKSREREIYSHLRTFIRKMQVHYDKQIKQRQVIVELDSFENTINCIGVKQRDLLAIKNIFKNLLQSTVILIIKFQTSQGIQKKVQDSKKYAKKVVDFPIHIVKIEKRAIAIISKQNIIKKFLQKQKFLEFINFNDKTQIGMFLPKKYNYNDRKILIEQVCQKRGYDFTTLGGFYHYFKKMFIQEDQQADPRQLLTLVKQVLVEIKQGKDKSDIPTKIKNDTRIKRQLQVIDGEYYSLGENLRDDELSKILKRDVMREKLRMSKTALVNYRVVDADESDVVYWYQDENKNKIKCQLTQMKPRIQYFCGKIKKLGTKQSYFIESKLLLI